MRQHANGPKPIVLDSDEEDNNKQSSTTTSKTLKRKLDFNNENEPPKKKVFWKNSISSDSVSETGEKRNNITSIEDNSSSVDQEYSGVDDYDHVNEDEDSSNSNSNSESSESESKSGSTDRKRAPIRPSITKNNTNRSKTNGFKLNTKEQPAKQKIIFQQRTDKSKLTHPAIITNTKVFPDDAQIKDIQGVSVWENQMIYFILM